MSIQDPLPAVSDGLSKSAHRKHVLSVDVEDYFQVEAFADRVKREDWEGFPSRVEQNTMRLLDLFDEFKVKGTFFLVGWVADRYPNLVREIVARGHEPACHSYWHRTVYSLTPEEFREDTRRSKDRIEQIGGIAVLGYRAPTWSITRTCLWALDVLVELGFQYDSSIYPIQHDLYGLPGAGRLPYTHQLGGGRTLREFPPATVKLAGMTLPAAGGGYLRIFPLAYTHWAFRQIEHSSENPVIVYLHPWEVDPEQPRIQGQLKSKFRHYTNLDKMTGRLRSILGRYSFWAFRDLLAASGADPKTPPLHEVGPMSPGLR
jgi:polysaccharide deacetylase family protein (PEP-CTERM system associated)